MKHKQGICPICGSDNISYDGSDISIDGNFLIYSAICDDCNTTFDEVYRLEFECHENIRED